MRRLVLLAVLLVLPAHAVADSPTYETIYDDYNKPVFVGGALVFLGGYSASVISAASAGDAEQDRGIDRLYIPVAGPWLALNDRPDCTATDGTCDWNTTKKVLLVVDGVLQAGGVIAMIHGVLQPSSHRVVTQTTAVRVTPTVVGQSAGAGLALFGRF
jgi:hypothetical protein